MTIFKDYKNNITVRVEPKYDELKSNPKKSLYIFSYDVFITNNSQYRIQIKRRSFIITDAFFNIEYVEGEGIVGQTPILEPGGTYNYISFCHLKTSFGSMKGYYTATDEFGNSLKIIIPEFVLAHPYSIQ